jgi:hypothetical protein
MVAYIKNVDGFSGRAMMQKWGITMEQSITIQIGKTEFTRQVGTELDPVNRPREGDLLYFPYGLPGQYLLEIKYVTDNVPFVELGRDDLYEIDCRMFTYSNEDLDTGISEIDNIEDEIKQGIEVDLGSGTGQFVKNEIVYQGSSFANSKFRAVVKNIDGSTLHLSNITGTLNESLPLKGNTSNASRAVGGDQQDIINDASAQNKIIQTKSENVVIKNSRNPFDKGKF